MIREKINQREAGMAQFLNERLLTDPSIISTQSWTPKIDGTKTGFVRVNFITVGQFDFYLEKDRTVEIGGECYKL